MKGLRLIRQGKINIGLSNITKIHACSYNTDLDYSHSCNDRSGYCPLSRDINIEEAVGRFLIRSVPI